MVNRVILVGRLTKDVELRKTNTNTSVCSFTLACNRRYASNAANGQSADFINCVAWRQSAEFLAKYAQKGAIVAVEGSIQTRNYEGQNGRVYVTEVVCDNVQLIGSNRSSDAPQPREDNQTFTPAVQPSADENDDIFSNTPSLDISSDDLPFY